MSHVTLATPAERRQLIPGTVCGFSPESAGRPKYHNLGVSLHTPGAMYILGLSLF